MTSVLARISTLRPGKTWIALGAALAIGLSTAFIARGYLNRQMQAIDARSRSETQGVLVAKQDLAKGTVLSRATLAVRDVPKDYIQSSALLHADFDRIAGRILEHGMQSGDMLMWSLLEGQKVPTFSARIEVGRRAITVHVDEINSISGLLEPGDAIDLMLTLDRKGRKTTFPLLQNVQVMATGQRSVDDPRSGERRQYSTVTLDTTQAQAQSVIIAREAGKITALLRNPKDTEVAESDGKAMAALLNQAGDVPALADTADAAGMADITARAIPVLYGGRQTGFTPDDLALRQPQQSGAGSPQPAALPPPASFGQPSSAEATPPAASEPGQPSEQP